MKPFRERRRHAYRIITEKKKQGYRSIIGMQADFCPKKGFNIKKIFKKQKSRSIGRFLWG